MGMMDTLDIDAEAAQPVPKLQKTASASSSRIRFDGVELHDKSNPTPKTTRRSTRSTKANSKKDVGELFGQLAKEYQAISKICEEISDAID
jgi:hypothetical protein